MGRKKSKGRGGGGGGRGRGHSGQEQLPRPGRSEAGAAKHPEEKESLDDEEPEEASCRVAEATSEPDQPISPAEEKPAFECSRAAKPIKEEKPQEKPSEQLEPEKPGPSHPHKGKTKGGKGQRQPVAPVQGESPTTSPPAKTGELIYEDLRVNVPT